MQSVLVRMNIETCECAFSNIQILQWCILKCSQIFSNYHPKSFFVTPLGRFCNVEKKSNPSPRISSNCTGKLYCTPIKCVGCSSSIKCACLSDGWCPSWVTRLEFQRHKRRRVKVGARSKEAPRLLVKHVISSHSWVVREASKSKVHSPHHSLTPLWQIQLLAFSDIALICQITNTEILQ